MLGDYKDVHYSQLSLNGHLCMTVTSIRRKTGVGPYTPFVIIILLYLTLYKPDTSLRRRVGASPDGVDLRESFFPCLWLTLA